MPAVFTSKQHDPPVDGVSNLERTLIALAGLPAPEVTWDAFEREFCIEWHTVHERLTCGFTFCIPLNGCGYYAWAITSDAVGSDDLSGHKAHIHYLDEELEALSDAVRAVIVKGVPAE